MNSRAHRLTRRAFLRAGGAVVTAAAGMGLYTWRIEPHWLAFVRRDLPIAGLPAGLDGARLLQLSDLHVGARVDSAYVLDTFRRAASLQPDVVAYTGDFLTYRDPGDLDELARVLARAPRGRLATIGILGNHDYGPGWRSRDIAAEVTRRAGDAGIDVLRNATADVGGLTVVGLADLWSPDWEPRAIARLVARAPALVLCHNPDGADEGSWSGFRGWILAGHTHGGQCKPPFLPPPLLPVRNRRYVAGEVRLADGRSLYINRGVGHLLRVRFNVRPEVTIFTLRPIDPAPSPGGA